MLSLQQTQRFANALAAAELVRRELKLPGDPFSLGFLVGKDATPNKIVKESRGAKESKGTKDIAVDDLIPAKYQVIEKCPFCRETSITMKFDRALWRLEHLCTASNCQWEGQPLPFYIVDDEIWRFLPTIVVGTLDKAANIARQPAMRGLVGSPWGVCSKPGHGFTYAIRADRPCGCLVPDCKAKPDPLPMEEKLFPPSFRLQDELHLLRDSLGAVDAHYESILDYVQEELSQRKPKILASSATLSGYRKQVEVLYQRTARVFPQPPPRDGHGFWAKDSQELMRRFIAVAPRGITIEFAVDRLVVVLQNAVRKLLRAPEDLCRQLGIDPTLAPFLIETYGTTVLYGNTLRDLDAVMRSSETQWGDVEGSINMEPLTGRTDFEKVRETLGRLEKPEESFQDRLHLVPASSMMSHGVDIDRLNVMVMIGLPLGTAEFIQATARVGRKWPAFVIVVHKIGRERDAGVFRAFPQYVAQGDRFVEPIPITRRSRRVLERTIAGLEFTRMNQVHEPETRELSGSPTALSTIKSLRAFRQLRGDLINQDRDAIIGCLGLTREDFHAVEDIGEWFQNFERNIEDPPSDAKFPSQISPSGDRSRSTRIACCLVRRARRTNYRAVSAKDGFCRKNRVRHHQVVAGA